MKKPDRIVKIRHKGKVKIDYEVIRETGNDEYSINLCDQPTPEFKSALSALAPFVCSICEWDKKHTSSIDVFGVTFSDSDKGEGVTISALKNLVKSDMPLPVDTPHMNEEKYGVELANALNKLKTEAEKYVLGERAQMTIPECNEAEESEAKPKKPKHKRKAKK